MTVMEYVNKFNHLAQYAGTHVDTNEKKRDHFYRSLSCILQKELYIRKYQTFGALMNAAIDMGGLQRDSQAEWKCKGGSLDLLVTPRLRRCWLSGGCPTTPLVDSRPGSLSELARHHLLSTMHLLSRCSSLRDTQVLPPRDK
jgi:hypothetical protein